MPVELVAEGLVARSARQRHATLVFVAQIAAIVVTAALTIGMASLPSSSIAGSAQEIVAGP